MRFGHVHPGDFLKLRNHDMFVLYIKLKNTSIDSECKDTSTFPARLNNLGLVEAS